MRAVYFIQETKNADLTMRQQQLLCLRAARRLRWYCCEAVFAEAGTEAASLALRPGMQRIECRKFAEQQGWNIIKELCEKGVSGFKISADDRDAIQELR